jgi:(2Fe-2S) ferredoxin
MSRFTHHVFVCQNERPADDPRGCCLDKGSGQILQRFRELIRENGTNRTMRANVAGCLSNCERGVSVVVYPEGIWYSRVKIEDVDTIFHEHLVGGKPVERLRDYL